MVAGAGHTAAAISVREQMVELQEAGLDRLYRWAATAVRAGEPELQLLAPALQHLQARPALFSLVLDEYTGARRAGLVRQFLSALTEGGPGGTPRPIELQAHDPARYCGDMLAWLHQACPAESELLSALLRQCGPEQAELASKALAAVTEGVTRPLQSRMEQILVSEPGPVVLYRLTNLIRFYQGMLAGVVGPGGLLTVLAELQQLALSQFLSQLQGAVAAQLGRGGRAGPGDLAPAPATTALLALLREILAGQGVVDSGPDLPSILACLADPLAKQLGERAAAMPSQDGAVFLVNNMHQLATTLSLYPGTEARVASLQQEIDRGLARLSQAQATHLQVY